MIAIKTVSGRMREVILRSIGVLIKCQYITEIHALLKSLFIEINETDGTNLITKEDTPCEIHKQIIMTATSTGFIESKRASFFKVSKTNGVNNIEVTLRQTGSIEKK